MSEAKTYLRPRIECEYDFLRSLLPDYLQEFQINQDLLTEFLQSSDDFKRHWEEKIKQQENDCKFKTQAQQMLFKGIVNTINLILNTTSPTLITLHQKRKELLAYKDELERNKTTELVDQTKEKLRIMDIKVLECSRQLKRKEYKYHNSLLDEKIEDIIIKAKYGSRMKELSQKKSYYEIKAQELRREVPRLKNTYNQKTKKDLYRTRDFIHCNFPVYNQDCNELVKKYRLASEDDVMSVVNAYRQKTSYLELKMDEKEANMLLREFDS